MGKIKEFVIRTKKWLIMPPEERPISRFSFVEGVYIAMFVLFISYFIDFLAETYKTPKVDTLQELLLLKIVFLMVFFSLVGALYQWHLRRKKKTSSVDNIKKIILKSKVDDWLFDDEEGIYTFKNNSHLTIRRNSLEISQDFEEGWLDAFADSKGKTDHHKIFYGNSFIMKISMVSVDGGRSTIPYPKIDEGKLSISEFQYKIGKIVNDSFGFQKISDHYSFDTYLERAKIEVIKVSGGS